MIFDATLDVCVENGTTNASTCDASAYQLSATTASLSVFDTSTDDNRNIYGLEVAQGDSITLEWSYYNLYFAQYNVGYYYANGWGVEVDYAKAVKYYTMASDQNHAPSQCELAILYEEGKGVEKDITKAYELFLKSANAGLSKGQYNVGSETN